MSKLEMEMKVNLFNENNIIASVRKPQSLEKSTRKSEIMNKKSFTKVVKSSLVNENKVNNFHLTRDCEVPDEFRKPVHSDKISTLKKNVSGFSILDNLNFESIPFHFLFRYSYD